MLISFVCLMNKRVLERGGAFYPDREVPSSCGCLSLYDLEHESNQNFPKDVLFFNL